MSNVNNEKLDAALDRLGDDDLEALADMIDESPELLRQTLTEFGYLDDADEDEEGFLTNRQSETLSEAQRDLVIHLERRLQPPLTVREILEIVGSEEAAFRQKYSSAQYRSWVSEQLNALVEAGELGRYHEGREVRYTESPELAVRHWARLNEQFAEELSIGDAFEIKDDTGMPARIVKDAIHTCTDG